MVQNKLVFLDTSILITALLSSRGGSFYLLSRYRDRIRFFINEYVLQETFDVLKSKFPRQKEFEHDFHLLIGFSKIEVLPNPAKDSLKLFEKVIEREDAPILASAVEHCDYLLTLDNDFFTNSVENFIKRKPFRILKPRDFIKLLEE